MADNYREETATRKRGRSASKLSVRLFLLDPNKDITKVTKEIGSEKGLNELRLKGYGPPSKEYCIAGDKVEFSLELTNEEFKQKLSEIYPSLKNACFVFMKAGKDNTLKELNPGVCCYRCYTPENVYSSERGQGRLYIRIISENEISPCNHGVPLWKR